MGQYNYYTALALNPRYFFKRQKMLFDGGVEYAAI